MSRRKQAKELASTPSVCFFPVFRADLRWWYRQEPKKANRIMDLITDVLDGDPFNGLGKPELLKYVPESNTWSR